MFAIHLTFLGHFNYNIYATKIKFVYIVFFIFQVGNIYEENKGEKRSL